MAQALLKPLHEDDYLTGEMLADVRHKFVNGGVYAMASTSENHNCISGNLYSRWLNGGNQDCRRFMSNMMLHLNSGNAFYYPDVMLVCNASDNEAYFQNQPVHGCRSAVRLHRTD